MHVRRSLFLVGIGAATNMIAKVRRRASAALSATRGLLDKLAMTGEGRLAG